MMLMTASVAVFAQEYVYTEASDLTIIGKLMPGRTANPYHRVDTLLYKGFTPRESHLVRMSSGMGCVFKTDSKSISVITEYGQMDDPVNTNIISARGYDLYILKDGEWLWAASGVSPRNNLSKPLGLISGMDGTEHVCLLYFPTYSEVRSIRIGVEKGSALYRVTCHNAKMSSTKPQIGITSIVAEGTSHPADSDYVLGGERQEWDAAGGKTYNYTLSGTAAGTVYYLYAYAKGGIATLELVYTPVSR